VVVKKAGSGEGWAVGWEEEAEVDWEAGWEEEQEADSATRWAWHVLGLRSRRQSLGGA